MNVSRWGPAAWTWLHGLSDRLPCRLNGQQVASLVDLSKQLESLLPCIYCRRSYGDYYRMIPLDRILTDERPYRILWDWWLWAIHNKVNGKLDKPRLPWDQLERSCYRLCSSDQWRQACWDFLFCLSYNYGPDKEERYRDFFGRCLPNLCQALPLSALSSAMAPLLLQTHQESLKDRESWTQWLYAINRQCADRPCEPYDQLCRRLDTYRAKACSAKGCH